VRILTRHLVARFLGSFAAFLIGSTLTIVVIEMMLNVGDMLQGDRGPRGVASYLFLRIPSYYLRDLLPIVAFAAAFFTFGSASRAREMQAMKAGGLSPHRVAAPLLWAALALSAGSYLLNETWILEATRMWNRRDSETNPISFRQGSFWYQRGRTIYNIGDADRATNTLRGVRIYELSEEGRLLRSIEAARANVEDEERWRFEAPVVRNFDARDRLRPPATTRHDGEVPLHLDQGSVSALMTADVTSLSVRELQEVIQRQEREGRETARPRALLHARLAEPFAVLLFVLAAVPLGVRVERARAQGMTVPALLGIAILAAFFSLRSVAETLTTSGLLPPAPTPWILLGGFLAFATWRYARMPA